MPRNSLYIKKLEKSFFIFNLIIKKKYGGTNCLDLASSYFFFHLFCDNTTYVIFSKLTAVILLNFPPFCEKYIIVALALGTQIITITVLAIRLSTCCKCGTLHVTNSTLQLLCIKFNLSSIIIHNYPQINLSLIVLLCQNVK